MKKLRYINTREKTEYMLLRQRQNRSLCVLSKAEEWANQQLKKSGYKWTRQAIWGFRLFDFWNHELGCAVEIDGKEHDKDYDSYRDKYNYKRSAIIVLRVRNFNQSDMELALDKIKTMDKWLDRRTKQKVLSKIQKKKNIFVPKTIIRRNLL